MKTLLISLLMTATVAFAAQDSVLRERQKGKLFPVLDPELFNQFEESTFEAFKSNPMKEDMKVGYALALFGYWWARHDLKNAKAYDDLALALAKKYALKNEEAQAVMGSAMLAGETQNMPAALERIARAISLFKEAGSKKLICDAMFYQSGLQQECGMKAERIKTLTEIESIAEGPNAHAIKHACRLEIKTIKAELAATKTKTQPEGATNSESIRSR